MGEPLTPVAVEYRLRELVTDLTRAQLTLSDTRDAEVNAKHVYEAAHRRAVLHTEAPKVNRGGSTAGERDAWVGDRCQVEQRHYDLAVARREAATDHLRTLRDQGMLVAALSKSVALAYSMAGTS
jgi:hypothetical protein